jgi:hypothetical protein
MIFKIFKILILIAVFVITGLTVGLVSDSMRAKAPNTNEANNTNYYQQCLDLGYPKFAEIRDKVWCINDRESIKIK